MNGFYRRGKEVSFKSYTLDVYSIPEKYFSYRNIIIGCYGLGVGKRLILKVKPKELLK